MIKRFFKYKLLFFILILIENTYSSIKNNCDIKNDCENNENLIKLLDLIEKSIRASLVAKCCPVSQKNFEKICKNFLGITSKEYFSNKFENQEKFLIKFLESISLLNSNCSNDLKFLFSNQIDYIIFNEEDIFKKINKNILLDASCLSFLISIIMPVEYSFSSNKFLSTNPNSLLKWHEMLSNFKSIFFEIASSKDEYLYKDFKKHLLKKLTFSDNYKILKCGFRNTYNYLDIWFDNKHNALTNSYKSIINKFINNQQDASLNEYLRLDGHIFNWLNSNYFNQTISYITNEDILFNLMLIGRIGSEKNIDLFELDEITYIILKKYSSLCREILNHLCKICKVKEVKWNNLNPVIINKNRINVILEYIALYSSIGEIFGKEFLMKYII